MTPLHKRTFLLILVFFYVILTLIHFQVDYAEFGRDDFEYLVVSKEYDFAGWTAHWYNNWSGRVAVHSAMYLAHTVGINVWRLVNPLFFLLLAYAIARVAYGPTVTKKPMPFFLTAIALICLISQWVFIFSSLWLTGSFNYLWTAALGLLAVLPYTDSAFHHQPARLAWYHILAGLYVVLGHEQMAVVMLLVMVCAGLVLFVQKILPRALVINLALMVAGLLIMITAPGNATRMRSDVQLIFPGFQDISIIDKIQIGLEFMFQSILNSNAILLLLFLGLIIYGLTRSKQRGLLVTPAIGVLFIACLMLVNFGKGSEANVNAVFYNFEHLIEYDQTAMITYHRFNGDFVRTVFSMLFWGMALLVAAPLGILAISRADKTAAIFNLLIYACCILSLVMLFFSPTMYASQERVRYVYAIFLVIAVLRIGEQLAPGWAAQWRPASLISLVTAVVFLLPYYLLVNNYTYAPKLPAAGAITNSSQQTCGVDQLSVDNIYVLNLRGWTAGPSSDAPNAKQVVLLQPMESGPSTIYHFDSNGPRSDVSDAETGGFPAVELEGRANFVDFPTGRYRIGLGTIAEGENIASVCYLAPTLNIEGKFKATLEE